MGRTRLISACLPLRRLGMGLVAALAMAVPTGLTTAHAVATPAIGVVSASSWQAPQSGRPQEVHIVGQVQNNTAGNVTVSQINVVLKDGSDVTIDTRYTDATIRILGPGEVSPFEYVLSPVPAGYSSFGIGSITFAPAISQPYHQQLATALVHCPLGFSTDWVCGTVTNNGGAIADGVKAILTYVDSGGIVAQEQVMVDGGPIAPTASAAFVKMLAVDEPTGTTAAGNPILMAEPDYPVELNPASVDFGGQNVGTTSTIELVTVTNTGSTPLVVSGATASGDFSATNDCGSTAGLAPGAACHVSVRFSPAEHGDQQGTLTVTDNAAGSAQTIPLTGKGTLPQIAFSPATPPLTARGGATSGASVITISNPGDGPLMITSITNDQPALFTVDPSGCSAAIAPGKTCPVRVTFSPPMGGPYNGTLTFHDNVTPGTQQLAVHGAGTGPAAVFNPAAVDFGRVLMGGASGPTTVTLTNNGTEDLLITGYSLSGDFAAATPIFADCPPSSLQVLLHLAIAVAPANGGTCHLSVTFRPRHTGPQAGTLTIADNAANATQQLTLSGVGVTPEALRRWLRATPNSVAGTPPHGIRY